MLSDLLSEPIQVAVALAGLYIPLFLVPGTAQGAGTFMSAAQKGVNKAQNFLNKQGTARLGNQLAGAYESRRANRQHNAVQRAKEIDREQPTSLGGKLSKNFRQRVAMKSAGHGGFLGGKGNDLKKLKFEEAASAAFKTQGAINASKLAGATRTGETNKQRVDAETTAALQGITKGRSDRAGLMETVDAIEGADLPEKMVNFAKGSYQAGLESSRKSAASLYGSGTGTAESKYNGNAPSTGDLIEDARKSQIDSLSDDKGKTEGRINGQKHLEDAELLHMGINPLTATDDQRNNAKNRIQQYRQTNARVSAREGVLDEGGKLRQGQIDYNTHRDESAATIMDAAALQQRGNLSAARQARRNRVAIQGTTEGHMSDREVEQAARREAQESIGSQVMSQKKGNQIENDDILAANNGDTSRTPSLQNRLIAAGVRGEDSAVATSAQRTGAVRSVRGYNGQSPTRPSTAEQLDDATFKATNDQLTKDMAVGERLQEVTEAEDRVLIKNGIDPSTASAADRANVRADISKKIAIQGSGEAGFNTRLQIAKARGEVDGFEKGKGEIRIAKESERIREEDIQRRLASNTGMTREKAEEHSLAGMSDDAIKQQAELNIAANLPGSVSDADASRIYHDASAEGAYLTAAQGQAGSIGQAVGKNQSVTAAIGATAGAALLAQARAFAPGVSDEQAMEDYLNNEAALRGMTTGNPSANREKAQAEILTSLADSAQADVIGSATLAGIDTGQRSEAAAQGTLIAQERAYKSPTKAAATAQLEMARRDSEASLAAKEADQQVRLSQTDKTYGEKVDTARKAASERQFESLVAEAGRSMFLDPSTGMEVPISTLKPNSGNKDKIYTEAVDAFKTGDRAKFTALTSALALTTSGSEKVRELLKETFGTDGNVRVDPTIASNLEADARAAGDTDFSANSFFQRVVSTVNADKRPDIVKGPAAAFENAKAGEVAAMDYKTKEHLFEFALAPVPVPSTHPDFADLDSKRSKMIGESVSNIKQIMTEGNINPKQTPADYDAMYRFLFDADGKSMGTPRQAVLDRFKAQFGSTPGAEEQHRKALEKIVLGYKTNNNL